MARRDRSNQSNQSNQSDKSNTEESNVSTITEAPVEPTEAADVEAVPEAEVEAPAEKPAKEVKPEADLTVFKAAVLAAVEARDPATGEVEESLYESITKAYREIDGAKGKNAAKAFADAGMKDAMNSGDINTARAYMNIGEKLTSGPKSTATPRIPADPTEAFVQLVVGLRLARKLAEENLPEGVTEDWSTKANTLLDTLSAPAAAYFAWVKSDAEDKGEEPADVSPIVKAAVKLSVGKSAKVGGSSRSGTSVPFEGERRHIAKHIAEAFEGVQSGDFLTVAQIRKFVSEEYGTNLPSAGAISARLFPAKGTCSLEGVTPGQLDGKGNKGAFKN